LRSSHSAEPAVRRPIPAISAATVATAVAPAYVVAGSPVHGRTTTTAVAYASATTGTTALATAIHQF
jgi:hypothetical protein